jgi:hypothetical protein
MRQVKLWLLLFSIHKTWSRRGWKKKEPSSETSFFMGREHGVIWPLSTFSHGMIQCSVLHCSIDPVAMMDSEANGKLGGYETRDLKLSNILINIF